ncbi:MAG: hypothetical protein WCF78_01700 [archaeon]
MIPDLKSKPKIVIDASFWINIVYLGLEKYLIKYFEVYFVSKVEEEILDESDYKIYDSEDMEIYSRLKDRGLITIKDPQNFLTKLFDNLQANSGELYSVALAIDENMIIATDDKGPIEYCIQNNVKFINSVHFCLYLYNKKEINFEETQKYFNLLTNKIKQKYIDEGRYYLKNKK